ncbi:hypothetical protein JCM5296_000927 [Sporobolomyces johnsonii]
MFAHSAGATEPSGACATPSSIFAPPTNSTADSFDSSTSPSAHEDDEMDDPSDDEVVGTRLQQPINPAIASGPSRTLGANTRRSSVESVVSSPSSDLESAWARPADESWSASLDAELACLVLKQYDHDGPERIDWSEVAKGLSGKRRTGRQVEGRWSVLTAAVAEAFSMFDEDQDDVRQPSTSHAADPSASHCSPGQRWTLAEDAALSSAVAYVCSPDDRSPSAIAATCPRSPDLGEADLVAWTRIQTVLNSTRTPRSLYWRFETHHLPYLRCYSSLEWSAKEDEEVAKAVDELGGRAKQRGAGWKEDGVEATAKWTIVRASVSEGAREVEEAMLRWGELQRGAGGAEQWSEERKEGEMATCSTGRAAVVVANDARPQQLQSTASHASSSAGTPAAPLIQSDKRDTPSTQSGKKKRRRFFGKKRFTSAEDKKLLELRGSGMPWTDVARELGRTNGSCSGRWYRLEEAGAVPASMLPQSTPDLPSQEATPATCDPPAFSSVPTPRATPKSTSFSFPVFEQGPPASSSGSLVKAIGPPAFQSPAPPIDGPTAVSPATPPSQLQRRAREDLQNEALHQARQDEVSPEDPAKETGITKASEEARGGMSTTLAGSLANVPSSRPSHTPSALSSGLRTVSTSEVPFSSEDDAAILLLEQQYPRRFKAISGLLTPLRHAREVEEHWNSLTSSATSNRSSAPPQLPPPSALSPPVPRAAAALHQSDSFAEPPAKRPRIDSSSSTGTLNTFLSANFPSPDHAEPVASGSNEAEPSTSSPSHPFTTPHSAAEPPPTVAYASGSTAVVQPVPPNPGPAPVARARPKPAEKPRRKVARVADFAHLLPGALEGLRFAATGKRAGE